MRLSSFTPLRSWYRRHFRHIVLLPQAHSLSPCADFHRCLLLPPLRQATFTMGANSSKLDEAQRRIKALELELEQARHNVSKESEVFSIGDQVKRFNHAKDTGNQRVLDIHKFFDGSQLKGKRVLVTGANRGLGLNLTLRLLENGANVVAVSRSAFKEEAKKQVEAALNGRDAEEAMQYVDGIDVQRDECAMKMAQAVTEPLDIVINNAGYFYEPVERMTDDTLNFDEAMKQIDICGLGPLRVSHALYKQGMIKKGSGKIAIITSQAGSIAWRADQTPDGENYGHHMSRSACNMMGVLLSYELKKEIPVALLHPGFNRTEMTKKYEAIWDEEGAVEPEVGALRVLHEINQLSLETTGRFINCEDGLLIPW